MKLKTIPLAIIALIALFIISDAPAARAANFADVWINEIAWMGTELSSNDEWIELKNNLGEDLDLSGWRLLAADGSPKIELAGRINFAGYFLLERTNDDSVPGISADQIYTGSLNNAGEWLKLYDDKGNLIDEINTAAGWPAGDNTTKKTLQRSATSTWQTSNESGGTPKAENDLVLPPTEPAEETEEPEAEKPSAPTSAESIDTAQKGDIIINEILPNPVGIDYDSEFIEIKNVSSSNIELTGWKITNAAKQEFIIPSLTMIPKTIVTFFRPQTKLALNNIKDKITLYSKSGKIIDQAIYRSAAPEDESYQKTVADKWLWGKTSAGKENTLKPEVLPVGIIEGLKQAGVGEIIDFDASDSFDTENRELDFSWDFGDGRRAKGVFVRQIYLQPGDFEIKLKIAAGPSASTTEVFKIKITDPNQKEQNLIQEQTTTTNSTTSENFIDNPSQPELTIAAPTPAVFISEFLPDPTGKDSEGEFVELFNPNNFSVYLSGWKIDDANSGSRPYTIPAGTLIQAGQYLAFSYKETKISLNNNGDMVRLINPAGEIIDQVEYEQAKEGISFVLDENFFWQQSGTPTPGEINVLNISEENQGEEGEEKQSKILGAKIETDAEINKSKDVLPKPANNKTKYLVSTISAVMILGLGTILKLRNKK